MCELLDAVNRANLSEICQGLTRAHQNLQLLRIDGAQTEAHVEAKNNISLISNRLVRLLEDTAAIEAKCAASGKCAQKEGECAGAATT